MVLQESVACRAQTAVWTGQCASVFLGCGRRWGRTAMLLLMGRVSWYLPGKLQRSGHRLVQPMLVNTSPEMDIVAFILWHLKMSSECFPLPRELIQLTFQFSSWDFLDVFLGGKSPLWFYWSLNKTGKSRWTTSDNPVMEGIWSDRSRVRLGLSEGIGGFLKPCSHHLWNVKGKTYLVVFKISLGPLGAVVGWASDS